MSDVENQKTAAFNLCKTAEIYLSQGKLDEAYTTCLNALEILPNCGEVYKTQGNVLQVMGKLELAKNSYIKAIEKNPNLAEAYANLGSMYARQQQWEQAINCYQKAISIKPNIAGFYRNLAKIWLGLGKYELVTECTYKALILQPESATATEYLECGDYMLKIGKIKEAISCYLGSIRLNSVNSVSYHKLGDVLLTKGSLDEALVCYRQVIKLSKNHWSCQQNIGNFLLENWEKCENKGDISEQLFTNGIEFLIQSLQLNKYNYSCYHNIADFLEKKYHKYPRLAGSEVAYKRIIYHAYNCGLCNRLRALCSCLCISQFLNIPLFICWSPNPECDCHVHDLYEPICTTIDVKELLSTLHKYHSETIYINKMLSPLKIYEKFLKDYVSHQIFKQQYLKFVRSIQMKFTLRQKMDEFISKHWDSNIIGLHVRRTDLTRNLIDKEIHKYQLSADNKFFEKIEKAISQGTYKFFLATDNRQTQISFQERFPQQIITFSQNFENERLRETSVEEALIDLYLLSKTNRIIGSYRSSFSQYASKLGGVPLEIA